MTMRWIDGPKGGYFWDPDQFKVDPTKEAEQVALAERTKRAIDESLARLQASLSAKLYGAPAYSDDERAEIDAWAAANEWRWTGSAFANGIVWAVFAAGVSASGGTLEDAMTLAQWIGPEDADEVDE
jgi:hypothetical protein